ncbi:unnamed protein product [Paramecium octaurelia]|uniref:Uncharacterized protein n=1 Tax=Paramecium octaurelia TaxID=43137 RepID=A0A8S1UGC7_PAROT|nr:unnamed protein product [Paramecium octaurelia]
MEIKRLLEYFLMIQITQINYNVLNDQDVNSKQIGIDDGYPALMAVISRKLNNVILVFKGQNDIIPNGKWDMQFKQQDLKRDVEVRVIF